MFRAWKNALNTSMVKGIKIWFNSGLIKFFYCFELNWVPCVSDQAAKKSRHSHVNVSWLRRTEYISTELTRYQPQAHDKIEATVGYSRRKAKVSGGSVDTSFCLVIKILI